MTTVRLYFSGERVGPQFTRSTEKAKQKMLAATRGAAQDVADEVVAAGRADIANAGKFGSRWSDGFQSKISEGGGNVRVAFTMPDQPPMKYWRVFEYGATIHGKPMLWIPLSFASDAKGINARDYPGKLFRVNRKGGKAPLLATGGPFAPKYFGKESVTIPKKFHLRAIIQAGAKRLKLFYSQHMKA